MMLRLLVLVIGALVVSSPSYCQSIRDIQAALDELISNGDYTFGCLANGRADERLRVNALVFGNRANSNAIVFNTWISSEAEPMSPCQKTFGTCAVYIGSPGNFSSICKPSRTDFVQYTKFTHSLREDSGRPELENTGDLLVLARRLQPRDIAVSHRDGSWYLHAELNSDGTLAIRLQTPSREIRVDRVRIALGDFQPEMAIEHATKYGTDQFRAFGQEGSLTAGGYLLLDGECYSVVEIETFRARMLEANRSAPINHFMQGDKNFWETAFDDALHVMLGGKIENGRLASFQIAQDPSVFVLQSGVSECGQVN